MESEPEPSGDVKGAVCHCVSDLAATLKPEYTEALRRVEIVDAEQQGRARSCTAELARHRVEPTKARLLAAGRAEHVEWRAFCDERAEGIARAALGGQVAQQRRERAEGRRALGLEAAPRPPL